MSPYDEVTGSRDFIRAYFPKIIFLSGSPAYKSNGSIILGTAEGGKKITLFNVDALNPKPRSTPARTTSRRSTTSSGTSSTRPSLTPPISRRFPARNVQDQCFEIYKTTESALQKGFISPYASKPTAGFRGTHRPYVNRSAEEWEEMLTTAGDTGRPKIEEIRNRLQLHEKAPGTST